jgi:hypothetical protein
MLIIELRRKMMVGTGTDRLLEGTITLHHIHIVWMVGHHQLRRMHRLFILLMIR